MSIDKRVIDDLLREFRTPEQILEKDGLIKQLTKAVLERALDAELTHHLREAQAVGLARLEAAESTPEPARRNVRNGQTLKSEHGQLTLEIPRDREASFEPILVPKHQRRLAGLDEKIIGLYASGMSDREISRRTRRPQAWMPATGSRPTAAHKPVSSSRLRWSGARARCSRSRLAIVPQPMTPMPKP